MSAALQGVTDNDYQPMAQAVRTPKLNMIIVRAIGHSHLDFDIGASNLYITYLYLFANISDPSASRAINLLLCTFRGLCYFWKPGFQITANKFHTYKFLLKHIALDL